MNHFLLHGGTRGGKQGDAQSADAHRWLAVAIRGLGVSVVEITGHDAFIEQIGAVNPEVVFVCFASFPTLIDVPDQDQKLGEGADATSEAM